MCPTCAALQAPSRTRERTPPRRDWAGLDAMQTAPVRAGAHGAQSDSRVRAAPLVAARLKVQAQRTEARKNQKDIDEAYLLELLGHIRGFN